MMSPGEVSEKKDKLVNKDATKGSVICLHLKGKRQAYNLQIAKDYHL